MRDLRNCRFLASRGHIESQRQSQELSRNSRCGDERAYQPSGWLPAVLIGHRFGPRAEHRFFTSEKGARRRAWAERSLHRFGMQLIIACRFIPGGGRTAITLTCGLIDYPRPRFVVATAIAAVIWALYAFFIGRLGGQAFEDKPWVGLLIALAGTVVISVLIEAARRIAPRRKGGDADYR